MTTLAKRAALRVLPYSWSSRLSWIRRYGLANLPAHASREIPGFMHDDEAVALYRLARSLPPAAQVVELGSWLGKSSVVIARGLKGKPGAQVHCVDPFSGAGDERSMQRYRQLADGLERDIEAEFRANVGAYRVEDRIVALRGLSHERSVGWALPIDFLFIDADHSYESVRRDFEQWSPHVKPGGWIGFHDAWLEPPGDTDVYHRGPAQLIRERVLGDPGWVDGHSTASLFVARRRA